MVLWMVFTGESVDIQCLHVLHMPRELLELHLLPSTLAVPLNCTQAHGSLTLAWSRKVKELLKMQE